MTTKLTLTYIDRKERTSAKTNKPFTSVSIKAKEYNDKFLSGFGNKANENWKVGDVVEVAEVREVSKDDKIYLNFEMPKFGGGGMGADVTKALEEIRNAQLTHTLMLRQIGEKLGLGKDPNDPYEKNGVNPNPPEPNFDPKTPVVDDWGFDQIEEVKF